MAISVQERTVKEFLQGGEKNCFLIPDYQRAYEWEKDEIDLLFDDLKSFTDAVMETGSDDKYFLGTIVSYINSNGERELIDGQQRTVSLFLLLRAIYTKLSPLNNKSEDLSDRLKEIRTVIWRRIEETSSKVDYTKNFIRSESIDDNYKDVLQSILETGKAPLKCKDRYSKNYRLLQKKFNEFINKEPRLTPEKFVYYLLHRTFVFSIEADSRDAALTIFSTINNRGKSLSDSDILRAKIYSFLSPDERLAFNDEWKKFVERADRVGEDKKDLFTYYMYYLRASKGEVKSTSLGVRKYFTQDNSKRLNNKNIIATLDRILNVWAVANRHEVLENEPWSEDIETLKIFDILLKFQNYSWRAAAVVYYLKHREETDFAKNFRLFMRKLFSQYMPLYMLSPDRTFMRECIFKLNVEILKSSHPRFDFPRDADNHRLKNIIITSKYYQRLMLKAAAYSFDEQTELLPNGFEVEHILPQKWYATYSNRGYTKEKFDEYVEQLGNLTLIESTLNKQLSNAPFSQKKIFCAQSTIAMTRALVDEANEWTPDSIAIRSDRLAESLIELWRKWSDDYDRAAR